MDVPVQLGADLGGPPVPSLIHCQPPVGIYAVRGEITAAAGPPSWP